MKRQTLLSLVLQVILLAASQDSLRAEDAPGAAHFRQNVQPILENYCYGCHGNGEKKGNRTLDEFSSDEALLSDLGLWQAVLKNVRAGLMPPVGEDHPSDNERKQIQAWIERDVFKIDPENPDPGRVTLRRLNRNEYRNTMRDLMGVEYDTNANFPADDTGYGFDNIADVLSISPLLMEKYMQAAETIVDQAVPTVSKVVAEKEYPGKLFKSEDGKIDGHEMTFYAPATVATSIHVDQAAKYRLIVEARIDGYYELDPGRCTVRFDVDGKQQFEHEYDWRDDLAVSYEFEEDWEAGDHSLNFDLKPLVPVEQKLHFLNFKIERIRIQGPLDKSQWVMAKNYDRFFPKGPPPEDETARLDYARDVLRTFATRAYRRPVDEATVDRLAAIAKSAFDRPDKSFEQGVAQAMVAVLASPRFLYRVEDSNAQPNEAHPLVDEYSLASRLSYFFWSTMPDQELLDLAAHGELRNQLPAQTKRLLADPRSQALVKNFTGQWLQARDVETISIEPVAALGYQKEFEEILDQFRAVRERRKAARAAEIAKQAAAADKNNEGPEKKDSEKKPDAKSEPAAESKPADGAPKEEAPKPADISLAGGQSVVKDEKKPGNDEKASDDDEEANLRARLGKFRKLREKFGDSLRSSMRRETEMDFDYVLHEDRSSLELIDCDYTFLNEELANYYGVPDVKGSEMRRVTLPPDSPRGGILTGATMLVVTSNPTRTSPVKRGKFILDNVLGQPVPPPPPNVPPLENSTEAIKGHEPTLREAQEQHRNNALCASCHAHMDPLGLALENFNALGMWRDKDHDQPIDTSGQLITGESFQNVRDLKKILVEKHRLDFYRCLTEKMLTYALGRGLEYYDEYTVDRIVEQLDAHDGRLSVLINGIVESAPFQRRRADPTVASTGGGTAATERADSP
jgi:Protein of unknown function (DUF1588)/Protein of unknown function (DUF1587)/Protein of unknown function (DUF1585)/Protein of unknown function (DUF1592)/Protein of unknown function (DUF1595)/Cytochrome C oxidase, cbb3-type, subunit III